MPPDEDDWVAAGLLDPASAAANDRRALLAWLDARGVSLARMVEAHARGRLFGLAGDLHARPERPTLTLEQAAGRTGLAPEVLREVWRRAGLALSGPAEPVLSEAESDGFAVLAPAVAFLGEEAVLRLTGSVGTAARRMAEAVIVAGIDESHDMLLDRSHNELATAQVYEAGMSLVPAFLDLVGTLFRLHHEAGNRHVELGLLLGDALGTTVRLAVGFVDISGYTPLARTLRRDQLAELVSRFASWAGGVVSAEGARVVQQLGDAVMFVGSPEAAARAALRLAHGPDNGALPLLRAGVAFGEVVLQDGDYFGPVVNLAARLTSDAQSREVLVDERLADVLRASGWEPTATPPRALKGIDERVVAHRLMGA